MINEFDERETWCIGKKKLFAILRSFTSNIVSQSGQRMNDEHFHDWESGRSFHRMRKITCVIYTRVARSFHSATRKVCPFTALYLYCIVVIIDRTLACYRPGKKRKHFDAKSSELLTFQSRRETKSGINCTYQYYVFST